MLLGERMLIYRANHDLTQTELANLLGTYSDMIYRIENGKYNTRKTTEIRLSQKLTKLEEADNENRDWLWRIQKTKRNWNTILLKTLF